jgi:hypothetical protein
MNENALRCTVKPNTHTHTHTHTLSLTQTNICLLKMPWFFFTVFLASLLIQMIWYKFVLAQYPGTDGPVFLTMCRFVSLIILIVATSFMFITMPDNRDLTVETVSNVFNNGLLKHVLGIGIIMSIAILC